MANWTVIDEDKGRAGTLGHTYAMKVPGGLLFRSITQDHGQSMAFVPVKETAPTKDGKNNIDDWIAKAKVT